MRVLSTAQRKLFSERSSYLPTAITNIPVIINVVVLQLNDRTILFEVFFKSWTTLLTLYASSFVILLLHLAVQVFCFLIAVLLADLINVNSVGQIIFVSLFSFIAHRINLHHGEIYYSV